jgi:hypothetical protein
VPIIIANRVNICTPSAEKKLKSDDEFFERLTGSNSTGGWQTGPASAMDLDGKETTAPEQDNAQKQKELESEC